MGDFYNGNKLLSLKDKNGKDPELYFCCGNRTAGKTFFFKRWMMRRFVNHGERFILFVRFIDDIANAAAGFWADIGPLAFQGHELTQKPLLHGKAGELLFDGRRCGYIIALNDPERIKRNSALFADAERGFLDEFMSEEGKYVPNELRKFNSIRISIARGGARGTHARRFPVYLCSNNVTLFNPYFSYLKIADRLQNRTHFLRGDGWVLEQTFNAAAAEALKDNFETVSEEEIAYAASNEYLLDNNKFVKEIPGDKHCALIIKYNGKTYGVWGMARRDIWYVSRKKGTGPIYTIVTNHEDHDEGTVLLTKSSSFVKNLRECYAQGLIRFDSGASKNAFLSAMMI